MNPTTRLDDPRKQLAPINAKLREGRALVKPVSQVTLKLKPVQGVNRFDRTVDDILRWMNNRAGRRLPDAAWQRKSFELADIGAQRTAAVALATPKYWAARLDDADKSVPLRTWVTEIGVGLDVNDQVLFGARLICASRGEDVPFDRTIPGFVRGIISVGGAELDAEPIVDAPRIISTEADVEWLVRLIERPDRIADVIVFSLPDGETSQSVTAANASGVASKTMGAAHTVVLTGPASLHLTDRIGKELSVFRQAVRTYKPGFTGWQDVPSRHPIAMAQRIKLWPDGGPAEFERWLIAQTLASSVHGMDRDDRLPAFTTVRQLAAQSERERARSAGGSNAELLKLYEADNAKLAAELIEQKELYDGLLSVAGTERESAQNEAEEAKSQNFALRSRIRTLEKSVLNKDGAPLEVDIPSTLTNFEAWCQENLGASVTILSRAYQGVKRSDYHDPTLLYRALLLLRDHYAPMRIEGGPELKTQFEEQLRLLELEESGTGDGVRFEGTEYTVNYGGRKRVLDRHLKAGNSRESRFCFRLYFFWDDESQCAVVGWLPSHLDNRQT